MTFGSRGGTKIGLMIGLFGAAMAAWAGAPRLASAQSPDGHTIADQQTDRDKTSDQDQPLALDDTAPPPEAFEGPNFAADKYWGAEDMARSRAVVTKDISGMTVFTVMADRLEYRGRTGVDGYLWDAEAWYGRDINKLWLKSEGEGSFSEPIESAEVQALWSHAISPYFDFQLGARVDFAPVSRGYLAVGFQGLAPYWLEIDAAIFLSDKGHVTARIEAEYDQLITQKLVLQPRASVNLSLQTVPEQGIGAGVTDLELGLRLRYHITAEFAPYIGIEWEKQFGDTARFSRLEDENASAVNYVVGLKFWF